MLNVKVTEGHVYMTFVPDDLSEMCKSGDPKDIASSFIVNILADTMSVIHAIYSYLNDKIGKNAADDFKETLMKHPEAMFGDTAKMSEEVRNIEIKKMKEDIRNADFY